MSIKIELNEPQKQEDIEVMLKNENSGSGGVEDYRDLLNLPKVNGVTLLGNKTSSDLGLQPQGDYAFKSSIPTKVSQLTNDSGFLTKHQDISNLATKEELNQKQDVISDLSTIRSNASKGATAVQPSQLSTVAISGSYKDLKDKPIIPESGGGSSETVIDAYTKSETDNLLSEKQDKGDYALKSSLPTKTSQLINDSDFLTQHQDISHLATKTELANKQDKGDYALKSEIPTKTSSLTNDSGFLTQHQNISHLATKIELNNKQDKGDYALKSDIPKVDLTNYALKSSLPTKTSQLINDSGFLTQHQDISGKQDKLVAGDNITIVNNVISSIGGVSDAYTKSETDSLLDGKQDVGNYAFKSEIPTATSQLTNDSGFLTQHQDISNLATKAELASKQDKLVAGDNITIDGNIISTSQSLPEIQEVDWTQPYISSNGTIGGDTFSISGTENTSGDFKLVYVFDKLSTTCWVSAGVNEDLILYNPNPIKITKFNMVNRNSDTVRPIASGTVYGSNDGLTYTQIATFTNSVETRLGTWSVDLSNNTVFYKYYKLSLVAVSEYCSLSSLKIEAKVNMTTEELLQSIPNMASKEYAKNASCLSTQYIDLTLGASGTDYTMPANGVLAFSKLASANGQGVNIYVNGFAGQSCWLPVANSRAMLMIPVRKDDKIKVSYTLAGTTNYFRFIYAESEV